MLDIAVKLVKEYGKTLSKVNHEIGVYGYPESMLPASRSQIRSAILFILKRVDQEDPAILEGLVRGYVYLAQFIPDEQAKLVAEGQASLAGDIEAKDKESALAALRHINQIKLEMEKATEQMRNMGFLPPN